MSPIQLKKGTSLELLTAAYFQAHGYLVRRSVTLTVAAGTAEATDIDLLAIRFNVPLAEERLVADCKDRKKSRPFERVLWTRGLATFADAQQALVVVPRAPWQAREFAAKGRVEILGPDEIEDYLQRNAKSYQPFGEADPDLTYEFDVRKKRVQYQDKELFREDLKLRQMLVMGQPLTNLNRIIRILSESTKIFRRSTSPDVTWLRRYLYFNAAVIASVMLLRFAAESKWTPEKDWSDHAQKRLTYGDVTPQKARQLATMAFNRDFFNGLPIPFYTEEIIKLIETIIAQPRAAAMVPYVIDFQLFGRLLRGIPSEPGNPQFINQEEILKLARRLLSVLAYAAEVPVSIWSTEEVRAEKRHAEIPHGDSTFEPDIPLLPAQGAEMSKEKAEGEVGILPTSDSKESVLVAESSEQDLLSAAKAHVATEASSKEEPKPQTE